MPSGWLSLMSGLKGGHRLVRPVCDMLWCVLELNITLLRTPPLLWWCWLHPEVHSFRDPGYLRSPVVSRRTQQTLG